MGNFQHPTNIIVEFTAWITPYLFYIFFAIILFGVLICIFIDRVDLAIRGIIIGFPALLASFLMIFIIKKQDTGFEDIFLFRVKQKFLILLTILLLLVSGIVFLTDFQFHLLFPLMIVSVYTLISIQILTKKFSPAVILSEIILTQIVFIGSVFFNNYYFGGTDIIPHEFMTQVTSLSASIIPQDLEISYASFPLYHIYVATLSSIMNIPIRTGIFLIAVIVSIISILFIFFIFKPIIQNNQVVLFCSLVYSMMLIDSSYDMYSYTLPRGLGLAGFLLLLYLLYTLNPGIGQKGRNIIIIFSIFMVFTVLVHQVSMLLIILLLCLIGFIELIWGLKKYVSYLLLLIMILFTAFYWFFVSVPFTQMLILSRVIDSGLNAPTLIQPSGPFVVSNFFFNNLTSQIVLFFAIIGIGYIFVRKQSSYLWVVAAFSAVVLLIFLPTPLSNIYQLSIIFGVGRFPLLIRPFIAIITGLGIIFCIYFLIHKQVSPKVISLILVSVVILCGVSSTGLLKSDTSTDRQSFNSDEISALNFGFQFIPYGSPILTDYYYTRYYEVPLFSLTDTFSLPYYKPRIITDLPALSTEKGIVIFPHKAFLDKGLRLGVSNEFVANAMKDVYPTKENVIFVDRVIDSNNKIYSDRSVEILILK